VGGGRSARWVVGGVVGVGAYGPGDGGDSGFEAESTDGLLEVAVVALLGDEFGDDADLVAAVLSPRTLSPSRRITPAPRNPIPDTI
jgi:hypothetical protein